MWTVVSGFLAGSSYMTAPEFWLTRDGADMKAFKALISADKFVTNKLCLEVWVLSCAAVCLEKKAAVLPLRKVRDDWLYLYATAWAGYITSIWLNADTHKKWGSNVHIDGKGIWIGNINKCKYTIVENTAPQIKFLHLKCHLKYDMSLKKTLLFRHIEWYCPE